MPLDGQLKPVVHLIFHVVIINVRSSKRIFCTSVITAMKSSAWRKHVVVCVKYSAKHKTNLCQNPKRH